MNKIGYLRGIFPDARFLILVRDIYSQANSLRKHLRRIAARGLIPGYRPGTGECWFFAERRAGAVWNESFGLIPRISQRRK
ncbi:MAG: sulfotransferase [Deltaproteobacteria bacterium]|nr:sulfotransferase [Deltaproteobacteria bacterium]